MSHNVVSLVRTSFHVITCVVAGSFSESAYCLHFKIAADTGYRRQ